MAPRLDDAAPRPRRRAAVRRAPFVAAATAVVALVLAGCGGARVPVVERTDDGRVIADVPFTTVDGETLLLDACLPDDDSAERAAVVLVHGGGFVAGDRRSSGMRALCTLVASQGAAAFSVDYRLAPEDVFPSQVEDVQAAVAWLREPEQVDRFGIDPARIGVLGSSAGAVLAQSVGTAGEGPLDAGSRVAAVVSLSGVSLMTEEGLSLGTPSPEAAEMILTYLGCETPSLAACPQAEPASALLDVDPSDPPTLLVNGSDELVPVEQAQAMADALTAAGVTNQLIVEDGGAHGVELLTGQTRAAVLDFLTTELAP